MRWCSLSGQVTFEGAAEQVATELGLPSTLGEVKEQPPRWQDQSSGVVKLFAKKACKLILSSFLPPSLPYSSSRQFPSN